MVFLSLLDKIIIDSSEFPDSLVKFTGMDAFDI